MDKVKTLTREGQTIPSNKGFTQINNSVLLDEQLSFKARGILALLLSRPKGWQIYVNEVVQRSDKDGRRAVQSGFKELLDYGYVSLSRVFNDETGRFEGCFYQLKETLFLPRQAHFRTTQNTDLQHDSHPKEKATSSGGDPKTAPYTKKESSNTKSINNKNQQQRSDAVGINKFWNEMIHNHQWKAHFPLSDEDVDSLLLHFRQTSLQQESIYSNLASAKRHFCNWFNANQAKGLLRQFINEQRQKQQSYRKRAIKLISKTDKLLEKIQKRICSSESMVIELKDTLSTHLKKYQSWLPYFMNPTEFESIETLIKDTKLAINQIDRGMNAQKLEWFCQNV